MINPNIFEIAGECRRFFSGHGIRSVRDRLQSAASSPLSLERNDGYGRGGVVSTLEVEVATLLGKEAAVFMPSGTMAQPIALRLWADRSGIPQVAFHPTCHLHIHEHMAYRELHHLEATLLGTADRLFSYEDLAAVEEPLSTVLIELPQREIGGQLPTWTELQRICAEAKRRGARLHLDGARLWECAPYYQRSYAEICEPFDSVYVSFYKILDGFPGAILAGPKEFIDEARIWQRRQGGNLQQQSPSAITAKMGMDTHLPRMAEYVAKAREIAEVANEFSQIRVVPEKPPTNMMHLWISGDPEKLVKAALKLAKEEQIALFFGLPEDGKWEISVGAGALGLKPTEIRWLFARLFELSD